MTGGSGFWLVSLAGKLITAGVEKLELKRDCALEAAQLKHRQLAATHMIVKDKAGSLASALVMHHLGWASRWPCWLPGGSG